MRFFSGLICGLLASASIFALAQDQNTEIPEITIPDTWNTDFAYPWSSASNNIKLQQETGVQAPSPNEGDDYPYIDLVESTPLLQLNRLDIQSVCISPYTGEGTPIFATSIFLTPDARQRVADLLIARGGQEVAFRWLGLTINSFVVDAQKAEAFRNNAGIYPDMEGWHETILPSKTDEELFLLEQPDLSFSSGPSSLYMGYTMTKFLAGTNRLEACEPGINLHDIPGYTEHLEFWERSKELYSSGRMKPYGYDY